MRRCERIRLGLPSLYVARDCYAEAAPPYRRSLAIWKMALGPEHPHVATSLKNYGALLRVTGRNAEANEMEARAKHAEENPAN